jgi:SAM-dependent methyltransferase
VGVDPNEPMLERARAAGGARYVRGQAEATGLPEASVALVTVAQAFHWFDQAAAFREFRRILRPGGWTAAFWNLRASSPFMDAYDQVLRAYSREYAVLLSHDQSLESLASGAVLDVRRAEFPNAQELDRAGLHGRAGSSSYVVHGVADREGFDRALDAAFDAHAEDGRVGYLYRVVGLCFRIAPEGV